MSQLASLTVEDVLERCASVPGRILCVEREASPLSASCRLEQLRVRFEGGETLNLLFKDLGPEGLTEEARRIRPQFMYDPHREIEVYRDLLPTAPSGPPFCYGCSVDDQAGRYWLFLERVAGRELYQVGDLALWQEVARWLALLHLRFTGLPQLDEQPSTRYLLKYDEGFYRLWCERAVRLLRQDGRDRTPAGRQVVEWLSESHERVIGRLLALPSTLIHGEFYASNVLVQTGDELRICPVDWEMAAIGPGLMDLAALTAGSWTDEQRTTIALAYYDLLAAAETSWRPLLPEFLTALDCCRLQAALQWLGWAPEWTPPVEHRHDWLSDVSRVIARVRV